MMKILLQLAYVTLCYHFGTSQETDCPEAHNGVDVVQFELYYDAGPDANNKNLVDSVLDQICPNTGQFGMRFLPSFKPGAAIKWDGKTGSIVCPNNFNGDCTLPKLHGCAYKLLPLDKFYVFVCCTRGENLDGAKNCAYQLGATKDDVNKCMADTPGKQDDAEKILVDFATELYNKTSPTKLTYPAPFFNYVYSECLAEQTQKYLMKTVCKQLAPPRPCNL